MSYLPNQILKHGNKNPISVKCDVCDFEYKCLYKSAERNKEKNGQHKCCKCLGFKLRPQNESKYWTKQKREELGKNIKSSEKYQQAISERDNSGSNNPMFGKTVSKETRRLMSESRTGKVGKNATAWKGGKFTVTKRVKGMIHGRYNWYKNVFERDKWSCVKCGCNKKIDAHHIDPVNQIIKRLCKDKKFKDDDEKVLWLIEQSEIIDENLKNGVTLCRECHKKEHQNWGSHDCK